ncbi:DNA circularization protein [Snodgrassella sp. CFCC 13594]|uniref:DNA circularization protein n=1 Tax=Snodgrassella sp. CFCC 13594 TaxID=1775559 RepID=UPI00082A0C75|nr:DNA circularization N-terminal domain-containing protein [Snodgrassella sp. CFCC 13594]
MSMWYNNLQPASYKGTAFDVLSVDDRNEKALAEHARPFVNGIDLEDMGTQGRQCQVSAVYYGLGFDAKMVALMNALEEQGAGVLVHPFFGRMQNMIASSWSFHTEADMVNYVALDITFREATEAQPIFVFENAWLAKLEDILDTLNGYIDQVLEYVDLAIAVKNGVSAIWGSALGLWSGLKGVVAAVRNAFDLDSTKYPDGGSYSTSAFSTASASQAAQLATMLDVGLSAEAAQGESVLGARQRYDATADKVTEITALPSSILTGQGDSSDVATRRIHKVTERQMQPIAQLLALINIGILIRISVELIENDSDTITATELMHVNNNLRNRIQTQIDALRATYTLAEAAKSPQATALYTSTNQTIELLRQSASQFNALVLALIAQKPPLRVRQAEFDGTIHQFAHAFYADIGRTEELMRLNPHLTHPSFISRGDWMNYYVK